MIRQRAYMLLLVTLTLLLAGCIVTRTVPQVTQDNVTEQPDNKTIAQTNNTTEVTPNQDSQPSGKNFILVGDSYITCGWSTSIFLGDMYKMNGTDFAEVHAVRPVDYGSSDSSLLSLGREYEDAVLKVGDNASFFNGSIEVLVNKIAILDEVNNLGRLDVVVSCVNSDPSDVCWPTYNFICGVDNNTYVNRCAIESSRVEIAHAGKCRYRENIPHLVGDGNGTFEFGEGDHAFCGPFKVLLRKFTMWPDKPNDWPTASFQEADFGIFIESDNVANGDLRIGDGRRFIRYIGDYLWVADLNLKSITTLERLPKANVILGCWAVQNPK